MFQLNKDYNLRGYSFEYIIRILLRRQKKNNFIFQIKRFTNIEELEDKYRIIFSTKDKILKEVLRKNWGRFDLIEFKLNNKIERLVEEIKVYDIKTKNYLSKRNYIDICETSYNFFNELKTKFNIICKIVQVNIFENWKFDYLIKDYNKFKMRIYPKLKSGSIKNNMILLPGGIITINRPVVKI